MSSVDPSAGDRVRVDVGIPTHLRPPYLGEAIESVLNQTLSSWRLTISENGPGGAEIGTIVKPYLSDRRVRHVTTGEDVGGGSNSTRLIRTGNAPYVAILHDDDRWDPGFLARRVAFLDANATCGLVFSSCDFIDSTGAVIGHFDPQLPEGKQDRQPFLRRLYRENLIPVCAVLVRRSAYETVGMAFHDHILFWDYDMWMRLATRFDVGFLLASDSGYRLHSEQTSRKEASRWWEHHVRFLDEIEQLALPEIPHLERMRTRQATLVRASKEALGRGDRRAAFAYIVRAGRAHPLALLDPVMLARGLRLLRSPAGSPTRPLRYAARPGFSVPEEPAGVLDDGDFASGRT